MKLKDCFAELRHDYKETACAFQADVNRLLDFTDKAIAALRFYEQHEKKLDGGHAAREVLALLEKEID